MTAMASTSPSPSATGLATWLRLPMQVVGVVFIVAAPLLHAVGIAVGSILYLLGAGAALLLLSVVDRIESFNAWGVSAKLREAQAAASQASATAGEVRRLALPLTRIALGLAQAGNRYGRDEASRTRVELEVRKVLNALNATPEERATCYTEWDAWRRYDKVADLFMTMHAENSLDRRDEISAFQQRFNEHSALDETSAQQIRREAQERNLITGEVECRIRELENFERNLQT